MLSNCFLEKQNTLVTKCLTGIHRILRNFVGIKGWYANIRTKNLLLIKHVGCQM